MADAPQVKDLIKAKEVLADDRATDWGAEAFRLFGYKLLSQTNLDAVARALSEIDARLTAEPARPLEVIVRDSSEVQIEGTTTGSPLTLAGR